MQHSDLIVVPMRREMTQLGFQELRTPEEVDAFMEANGKGTALIAVNSICGCAAGTMRPAVARALEGQAAPHALGTVFAGRDIEATERARSFFTGYPPSSPAIALFKDGELVEMFERHHFKGRHPQMVADELAGAFERHFAIGSTT
jgi:putative YphP/YqiW family bacilliredoxin